MGDKEPWWLKFDWGPQFGVEHVDQRAFMIADMIADTDDERERYCDVIQSEMLRYYNRVN
jgi:hypothetical protein